MSEARRRPVIDDDEYEEEGRRFPRVSLRRPRVSMEMGVGAALALAGTTALVLFVELFLRRGGG